MAGDREQRSLHFEVFLSQTLLPDLQRAEAAREGFAGELRAYEDLRDLVLQLQKARRLSVPPELAPWTAACVHHACMYAWRHGRQAAFSRTLTCCTS